ncbi:MAG TPA: deoxyribonuclease V [Gammaproteobacteria bacterium]|jgi:deoxyribonuclease V
MIHVTRLHNWNVTPSAAIEIQKTLADKVIRHDTFDKIQFVAGIDVGFEDNGRITRAAVCILDSNTLQDIERTIARRPTEFPYVPGLLSFREIPAIIDALEKIKTIPQMLFCDGQGYAHPRRLGIASHLGILTGLPSIGVGKSRLVGRHQTVPNTRGAWVPLVDNGETVGAVLRTRVNVNPLYISSGHKIALESAVECVMRFVTRYKLPEPTRLADRLASRKTDLRKF